MTPTEVERDQQQRRVTDVYLQMEMIKTKERNNTIMAYCAGLTFAGVVITAISVSQAKEVMKPISDQVMINKTEISAIKADISEIKVGQNETNRLLRELVGKK